VSDQGGVPKPEGEGVLDEKGQRLDAVGRWLTVGTEVEPDTDAEEEEEDPLTEALRRKGLAVRPSLGLGGGTTHHPPLRSGSKPAAPALNDDRLLASVKHKLGLGRRP
jgi:hypothetical protein